MEISCKGWYSRHANDDFVSLAVLKCANDSFDNGSSKFILHWMLGIIRSSNKKLILDIDEVLTVVDYLDIGICNGML